MKTRIASFLGVLLLGVCPLLAAVDAFIKFDGITGESHHAGRTGWIDIESVSFGVSRGGSVGSTGGGHGAGKVAVHDISITKIVDKSSPMLMSASQTGKHFPTVLLDVKRNHYEFQDVIITSVQHSQGSMGDGSVREVIKMSYVREIHDPPVNPNPTDRGTTTSAPVLTQVQPNAAFGGGVSGGAMLQSLRLVGQTQAIIVVCDVAGGQTLAALQRASRSRQAMPTLSVKANPKQAGQPYLQFTFTNAVVSSYSMAPGGCSQITLNFSKFDGPASGY